jgi:hypothetical protein
VGAIVDAAVSAEFLAGLQWGGVAAVIALAVGVAWRRWRREPAPVAGLAALAAAAAVMPIARRLPGLLVAGLALLALAGAVFPRTSRIPIIPVLLALPGAWVIGASGIPGPGWAAPLVVAMTAVGGPLFSWFDEKVDGPPIVPLLFALATAGVWATVPDTEEALVLVGAVIAPTLLAWPLRVARLGPVGGHARVGLCVWVVAWGGRGREGSIVGAMAALGMLMVAPTGAWIARQSRVRATGWYGIGLISLQLVVVAATTRIAGLRENAADAASIAIPTLMAALLIWVLVQKSLGPGLSAEGDD